MVLSFENIPFVAYDYLVTGDPSNLTPEQIQAADEWNKYFEIIGIEEYMENETFSSKLADSLINDIDFIDDG